MGDVKMAAIEGHLSAVEEEHAVCASINECAETTTCKVAMKASLSCHGWCLEESEDEEDPCNDLTDAAGSVCEVDVWACMGDVKMAAIEGHLSAVEEEHAVCASINECAETTTCKVAMKASLSCHG